MACYGQAHEHTFPYRRMMSRHVIRFWDLFHPCIPLDRTEHGLDIPSAFLTFLKRYIRLTELGPSLDASRHYI